MAKLSILSLSTDHYNTYTKRLQVSEKQLNSGKRHSLPPYDNSNITMLFPEYLKMETYIN